MQWWSVWAYLVWYFISLRVLQFEGGDNNDHTEQQIDQRNNFTEPHEYTNYKLWIDLISSSCLVFTADITDNPLQALKDMTSEIMPKFSWDSTVFPPLMKD